MEIERILEIYPYNKESRRDQLEYADNKDGTLSFMDYLTRASVDNLSTSSGAICYQASDFVMAQYSRMQNNASRIKTKLGNGE